MNFDFTSLITDRTSEDVSRVRTLLSKGWASMTEEEKSEWNAGMKGAYNTTDINRVIEAVNYLNDLLQNVGYYPEVNLQTANWTENQTPTTSQMQDYLNNIKSFMNRLSTTFSVDLPLSMELLTYDGANNIEQILIEINTYISILSKIFLRAGMAWAVSGGPDFYFVN